MTLRLILTRHAKSDWSQPGQSDADRPLNRRGQRDAPRLGLWLASRGYLPDLVLCSTAARTRETLDLVLTTLGSAPEVRHLPSLYHAEPEAIQAELARAAGKTVMVVGHNPGIAAFAQDLVHDRPLHPRFDDFPTAATAVIDFALPTWAEIGRGQGAIRDFVVPDDLE